MSNASMTMISTPRFFGFTTLLLASMFLLTSCQAEIKSVAPTPNPNPKEIYEITITVENAPSEFAWAEASVPYGPPRECLPPAPPFAMTDASGVKSWLEKKPSIKRLSPTTFVARVILDAYIPRNDYGLGLCTWVLQYVAVRLYNGKNEHYASISSEAILQEASIKEAMQLNRFSMKASPESGEKWLTNSGRDVTKENENEYPANKYFYVLINSKKVLP